MTEADLSMLDCGNGTQIAIRHRLPSRHGRCTVLFLPGYASDMEGQKAVAIDRHCAARGSGCLRLDYSGTGSSAGDFADGTLHRWLDEVLVAIDLVEGPIVLAGSSMGGWLALHAALARSARIAGLIGIAAAPDFTDWGFAPEERERIAVEGKIDRFSPYAPEPMVTHRGFWQSGQQMLLLGAPIEVACAVRLVVGEKDEAVPAAISLALLGQLRSPDVQLKFIKDGGHRLSEPNEIAAILAELDALLDVAEDEPMPSAVSAATTEAKTNQ